MAQYPRALTNRPGGRTDELDPRLQIAKHPFVAAAVVLGGVFVATRIVQSMFRRVRAPKAHLKEARE